MSAKGKKKGINDQESIEMNKKIQDYKDIKQNYIQCCSKFQISPLTQINKKIDEAIMGKPLKNVYKSY